MHLAALDGIGRQGPCLEKPRGTQPLIDAEFFCTFVHFLHETLKADAN
jgi:hypothetical protein